MKCLQGASAVQGVLERLPQRDVRVFTVWVPILASDTGPPDQETMLRLADSRVRHYWDPEKQLAAHWQPVLRGESLKVISKESLATGRDLWDFAALFEPGAQWASTPPAAVLKFAPVADHDQALLDRLKK